jgi:adenylate cyclase
VNAVRAAARMRRALGELNRSLAARGLPTLRTGIGIHRGMVVAGNIESEKRMEYGARARAAEAVRQRRSHRRRSNVETRALSSVILAVSS